MTRDEANDRLADYVESNCPRCYVKIVGNGMVFLDDKFLYADLIKIMGILDEYFEED
jgi:hypothetical protein